MGRGRGKGKKLTGAKSNEDRRDDSEQPLPSYKRRGRPQKPLKDDTDDDEIVKVEEDEGGLKLGTPIEETKESQIIENGKRIRRQSMVKENSDSIIEENGTGLSSITEESATKNGFRRNGSRRKSKPHRAAEAGVEFK